MMILRRTHPEIKRYPYLFVLLGAWKVGVTTSSVWDDARMCHEPIYYIEKKDTILTGSCLAVLDMKAYRHIKSKESNEDSK